MVFFPMCEFFNGLLIKIRNKDLILICRIDHMWIQYLKSQTHSPLFLPIYLLYDIEQQKQKNQTKNSINREILPWQRRSMSPAQTILASKETYKVIIMSEITIKKFTVRHDCT